MRLFVGIELDEAVIRSLDMSRGGVELAHWQRDEQLHLTLAFIGDVSNNQAREIEGELSTIYFHPFDMQLSGVGMFGKYGKGGAGFHNQSSQPRALWAGVADKAPLDQLHDKINHSLRRVGVEVEQRAFKPHVTLARFRKGTKARVGDWLAYNEALKSPVQHVHNFTLFSSELTNNGSYYTPEARFGLDLSDTLEAAEIA